MYAILQVRPQNCLWSPKLRRWSWRIHGKILPLLHWWERTADVHVNLRVLWNKALPSVDAQSFAYEHPYFWTYNMLPYSSRWILNLPNWVFPRWMHAVIELRTVYLNQAIEREIQYAQAATTSAKIRLVVLGGGYDTRSIRLLTNHKIQEAWELDLPKVTEAKSRLMKRLCRRIPRNAAADFADSIHFLPVNLNDLDQVESTLLQIIENGTESCYTIVISEAICMYLDPNIPDELLKRCGELFGSSSASLGVSFCFADQFEAIRNQTDEGAGRQWLERIGGWDLIDWLPNKPGSTRHTGVARH